MSDESKNSAGLFRLQDLKDISVENESLFPKRAEAEVGKQAPPIPDSGSSMVEAIRRARASQPEPVDELDELPSYGAKEPTPDDDSKNDAETDEEGRFVTADHFAMAEAMAADQQRARRKKLGGLTAIAVGAIGGLVAALVILLQPSPVMEDRFPTFSPTLVSYPSGLDPVDIALIPVVEPEPAPVEDENARARENRDRNRDRDRNRNPRVNRGDLF